MATRSVATLYGDKDEDIYLDKPADYSNTIK